MVPHNVKKDESLEITICKNHKKSCKCIQERIIHLDGSPCGGRKILIGAKEYTIISSV